MVFPSLFITVKDCLRGRDQILSTETVVCWLVLLQCPFLLSPNVTNMSKHGNVPGHQHPLQSEATAVTSPHLSPMLKPQALIRALSSPSRAGSGCPAGLTEGPSQPTDEGKPDSWSGLSWVEGVGDRPPHESLSPHPSRLPATSPEGH